MAYLGYMVMNRGTSVPVSTCQTEQKRTLLPPGVLIGALNLVDDTVCIRMRPGHIERKVLSPHVPAGTSPGDANAGRSSEREVFAFKIGVNPRTLERWEQGRSRPNEQASALIRMVRKFPDILERLESLSVPA